MGDQTYDMPRRPRPIASSPFWTGSGDANSNPGFNVASPPGQIPTPMGWLSPEMLGRYANAAAPPREDVASVLGAPMDGMAWVARQMGVKGIPSVYGQPDFTQRAGNGDQLVPKPSADVPLSSENLLQLMNRYIPRGGFF